MLNNIEKKEMVDKFCGKYDFYPQITSGRISEGGLRTKGIVRKSLDNEPLVSIITVVFNGESSIERTINSVIDQSYKNLEYIVIDGGSNDRTLEIIRKYEQNIDYYISEPDQGIYDAMNKGIELAKGEFIALLNSDDFFSKDAISISIKQIIENQADYSGGDALLIDEFGNSVFQFGLHHFNKNSFFSLNPCSHISMVVNKEVYNTVGKYDINYRIASDLKFQLNIIRAGFKAALVNDVICFMELNGISSSQQDLSINEVKSILSEFHPNLNSDEIDSIAQLRYRDQLSSYSLDMLLKVIESDHYTNEQKQFIKSRVQNCYKKTMYFLKQNENSSFSSSSSFSPESIDYFDKISFKSLVKYKTAKKLKNTILFKPMKLLYKFSKKMFK